MLEAKGSMGRPWACHQQHANHVALLVPFLGKAVWPMEWETPSYLTFLPHTAMQCTANTIVPGIPE